MSLPNREGRFLARVTNRGVDCTGPNKLLTFTAEYHLVSEKQGGELMDCSQEEMVVTGYHYMEKTDGSLNTRTIENLKESFGWDGADPMWLQEADIPEDHLVQVTLEEETYNNRTRIKVAWVNPADDEGPGGVKKASDTARKAIAQKYGQKFRANAVGIPAPAKPAAGKPALPSKSPAKSPPAKKTPKIEPCTQEQCWEAHCQSNQGASEEELSERWWAAIEKVAPGTTATEGWTPEQWGKLRACVDGIPF